MALFLLKKRRKTRLEETNMNRNTLAALSLTASLSLTVSTPSSTPPDGAPDAAGGVDAAGAGL